MIKMFLNDIELPSLEVPLSVAPLSNEVDVVTADNNMYTSFALASQKKLFTHTWRNMSESDYNVIKGIYDAQFVTYEYPLLSIPHLNIEYMPVKMNINPQEIYNNCGSVQNVTISLRESGLPSGGGS